MVPTSSVVPVPLVITSVPIVPDSVPIVLASVPVAEGTVGKIIIQQDKQRFKFSTIITNWFHWCL